MELLRILRYKQPRASDEEIILLINEESIKKQEIDYGYNPLMVALEFGYSDKIINKLITKESIEIVDVGSSRLNPLILALSQNRSMEIINKLITKNTIRQINKWGETPLLAALYGKYPEELIIRLMSSYTICQKSVDYYPIELVYINEYSENVISILKNALNIIEDYIETIKS